MNKMKNVPDDTITGKDLDYLSDVFLWNYNAWKQFNFYKGYVYDNELVTIYENALEMFDNNMNTILDVLSNPGGDCND
jgi:hypothetical protein